MSEELVALYDPDDVTGRVVDAAPRSRMRAENLPHAASSILLRRSDGRVLVHQRAAGKDLWPSMFDAACGGVIGAGETPEQCAVRELAEEVGVRGPALRPLLTTWYRDERTQGLVHLYGATWDGEVRFVDGEVAAAWWLTPAEVAALLVDPARPLVPDSRMLLDLLGPALDGSAETDDGPWPAGATALYRSGRFGRVTRVVPAVVVADEGPDGDLVLWVAEGSTTVKTVMGDGRRLRDASLAERIAGPRRRVQGSWRRRGAYVRVPGSAAEHRGSSVWSHFNRAGAFHKWYGNLEAPAVRRRTARGTYLLDTADRALDVVVTWRDGGRWPRWKDEDEFAAFTGAPWAWTAEDAPAIRAEGERLMTLASTGAPPFDHRWTAPPDPMPAPFGPRDLPPDWDLPHVAGP